MKIAILILLFIFFIEKIGFSEKSNDELDIIIVGASCYNPDRKQCDEDYNVTASGRIIDTLRPLKHRFIALSRDLAKGMKYGAKVYVSGTEIYDGVWQYQDKMNKRWKNKIDFLVGKKDYISKWDSIKIIFL